MPSPAKGMYDPKHGRWLQRDPLRTEYAPTEQATHPEGQYADGMNLHEYVGSRPSEQVDALGTKSSPCTKNLDMGGSVDWAVLINRRHVGPSFDTGELNPRMRDHRGRPSSYRLVPWQGKVARTIPGLRVGRTDLRARGGYTQCNPNHKGPDVWVDPELTPCKKLCVSAHEDRHRNQIAECCGKFQAAWQDPRTSDVDREWYDFLYKAWQGENYFRLECEAYAAGCACDLFLATRLMCAFECKSFLRAAMQDDCPLARDTCKYAEPMTPCPDFKPFE